ncbi:SUN domain-containing protein 2-like [Vombatus ursinus]|uniref:SUN domain-containing protein 2-like n=1 Tax=Vombatus ursinus TaxID=29139 RepID=UPI000FFD5C7C|nr:SUN domain-containing protein 2-like [Vombatus ursinus]
MSRRSERLRLRYQALGDGGNSSSSRSSSSSGGNSQVAEQHTNRREGPLRTLRRKSSRVKGFSPGLSPAPHLALYTCNTPESSSGYFSEDDSACRHHFFCPGGPFPRRCPTSFKGCPIAGGGASISQIRGRENSAVWLQLGD